MIDIFNEAKSILGLRQVVVVKYSERKNDYNLNM